MNNTFKIHICSNCNSYCDSEECFFCDEMTGVLSEREDSSNQDIALIKEKINHTQHVKLYLSSFGDAPGHIATIDHDTNNFIALLEKNKFVFNGISGVGINGEMKNCLGLAFLNQVDIQHSSINEEDSPVFGIMILID